MHSLYAIHDAQDSGIIEVVGSVESINNLYLQLTTSPIFSLLAVEVRALNGNVVLSWRRDNMRPKKKLGLITCPRCGGTGGVP